MKAQHQVSATERALLVGVGWKRAPRFPGMPAGEQGRESLLELVELARSAGAEVAGTVFQVRDKADPAALGEPGERAGEPDASAYADLVKRNLRRTGGGSATAFGRFKRASRMCANSEHCGAKRGMPCLSERS